MYEFATRRLSFPAEGVRRDGLLFRRDGRRIDQTLYSLLPGE
jgi:hypothetical protein